MNRRWTFGKGGVGPGKDGGRHLTLLILLAALAVLAGCAGLGRRLEPPRVQIAGIQIRQVQGLEAVFAVDLRVMNANETAVEIRGVDCALEINGRPFAAGVSRTDVKIDAFDTGIVPVTIYSSVIDMVRGMFDLPVQKALTYKINGKVRLGAGTIPATVPFSAQGTLSPERISGG